MSNALIETQNLTINFGGHRAVDDLSLSIEQNTFTAIIGPNGAGKTTFFNLLSGLLQPTSGRILFKGADITGLSPMQRVALGIGRSFQLTNVFPTLTVHENVRLVLQSRERVGCRPLTSYRRFPELIAEAEQILADVLLLGKGHLPAARLSHGEQRKLEMAMVLAMRPQLLLLDEPTAGMALEEVPVMLELLTHAKARGESTIVLIEHKMDLVTKLSDRVLVLVNGALLTEGTPAEVAKNPDVLKAYLGGGIRREATA
ncbi:MAG: Lipopolysaccharide export system ATP-binding protein LptB [Firmicutes bacterium]|nr:Lipopolysaccharide export system ATP-binding protein LptB [Bacillota bacterium]